jgi:uncharacterized surface protein with fasciclin (FAS1) repeats
MRNKKVVTFRVPKKEENNNNRWLQFLLYGGAAVAGIFILTNLLSNNNKEEEEVEVVAVVGDIVDFANGTVDFSTLGAALEASDLVETLKGKGPFTVFAPTDEAFAALPKGVLAKLLLPKNKSVLAKILKYHVVSGKIMAADITDSNVPTVEGQTVALKTRSGVTVNNANVIAADIAASNGVIHAIDAVLIPPGVNINKL